MAEDITDQVENLTDDQLRERLEKLSAFYKDQLPRLRVRHEYEKLHCELEEFATRRLIAQLRRADLLKPADKDPKETEDESGSTDA